MFSNFGPGTVAWRTISKQSLTCFEEDSALVYYTPSTSLKRDAVDSHRAAARGARPEGESYLLPGLTHLKRRKGGRAFVGEWLFAAGHVWMENLIRSSVSP